jgi:quercetin dioxygenase-like cupin family protein
MKYARLYSGKNGQSHFEPATLKLDEADYRPPAPMVFVSHAYQTDGVQFIRLPSGWAADSISPPKKQFLICLKGHLEVTAGDGDKRTFGPGDTILMEDIDGKGHRTRVKGDDECLAAVIPID